VPAAQKFIAGVVSPKIQARIPAMMGYYGPTNAQAFEQPGVTAEQLAQSNMSPANREKQVLMNAQWWGEHMSDVQEDYKELIAQ
jgi:putative spermidine/putrescine transport system substrate-binding protein